MRRLVRLLAHVDVFFVAVQCPLPELRRRELDRANRRIGEAQADHKITHTFGDYDFEIDSTQPPDRNVAAVIAAWSKRRRPSAFEEANAKASGETAA